jgi:hypothetical protein
MIMSHIHYRVGTPATTEIPLDGQGRWLTLQEDGESSVLAISGPRGGALAVVRLDRDLAELLASALVRKGIDNPDRDLREPDEDGYRAAVLAHKHHYAGQTLRHAHTNGDLPHGYFEHPEDSQHDGGTSGRPEDHWRAAREPAGEAPNLTPPCNHTAGLHTDRCFTEPSGDAWLDQDGDPAGQAKRDRLMPQACSEFGGQGCGGEVPEDGAEPDHLPGCPKFGANAGQES